MTTITQGARIGRQTTAPSVAERRRKAIADALAAEVSAVRADLADFETFAEFLDDETDHLALTPFDGLPFDAVVAEVQDHDMSCAVTDRISW